jgi:Fe-S-cluster-containing dehydrogenase component
MEILITSDGEVMVRKTGMTNFKGMPCIHKDWTGREYCVYQCPFAAELKDKNDDILDICEFEMKSSKPIKVQ